MVLDGSVSTAISGSLGYHLPRVQIDGRLVLTHVCNAHQALIWGEACVQAPRRDLALARALLFKPRLLVLQFVHPGPYFIPLHAFKLASRTVYMVSVVAEPGRRLSASNTHLLLVNAAASSALIGSPLLRRVSWIRQRLALAGHLGLNLRLALENPSLLEVNGC